MVIYKIRNICYSRIRSFYRNVSYKYCHTYSLTLMFKNIDDAFNSMLKIENGLLRRRPTISRWISKGYLMANTKTWYFAYRIEDETIYVEDACHSQNMHEAMEEDKLNALITESLRKTLLKYA